MGSVPTRKNPLGVITCSSLGANNSGKETKARDRGFAQSQDFIHILGDIHYFPGSLGGVTGFEPW